MIKNCVYKNLVLIHSFIDSRLARAVCLEVGFQSSKFTKCLTDATVSLHNDVLGKKLVMYKTFFKIVLLL